MTEITINNLIRRLAVLFLGVACVACFGDDWEDSVEGSGSSASFSADHEGVDSESADTDRLGNTQASFLAGSTEISEATFVPERDVADTGENTSTPETENNEEGDDPAEPEDVDEPVEPEEESETAVEETEETVEETEEAEEESETVVEETEDPEETVPAVCGDGVVHATDEVCDATAVDDGCSGSSACLFDCSVCIERPHVIFTTSSQYTGDLVSEANELLGADFTDAQWRNAADGICQNHADEAGLNGTFMAVIDGTTDGERDRIFDIIGDTDGPWARLDGVPIADSVEELRSGRMRVPVTFTEAGDILDSRWDIGWTGAGRTNDCLSWTSDISDDRGTAGLVAAVSNDWSNFGYGHCDSPHHLTCIEVGDGGLTNIWPPVSDETQLVAFTTEETFDGDLLGTARQYGAQDIDDGREAANYLCDLSAEMGGLDGTFRAFLGGPDVNATDYFADLGMNGPWYTPDGFLAVADLDGLDDDAILIPFHADAAGNLLEGGKYGGVGRTWTGLTYSANTGAHCEGWTSNSPDDRGESSLWTVPSDYWWRHYGDVPCHANYHLYCFQEM